MSGICLGSLLGGYFLLMKPVISGTANETVLSKPGNYDTYFAKGGTAGGESTNYRNRIRRVKNRTKGPTSFSEDDINFFFSQFKSEKAPLAEGAEPPQSSIEQFNVKITGDQMYVSFKLIFDPTGDRFEVLVKANMSFENSNTGPEMRLSDFRLNSLPVPGMGGLLTSIISSKVEGMALPDDLLEMWENIRSIELESDKVIVDIGLRRRA